MARLDAQQRPLLEAAVELFAEQRGGLNVASSEAEANAFVAAELLVRNGIGFSVAVFLLGAGLCVLVTPLPKS